MAAAYLAGKAPHAAGGAALRRSLGLPPLLIQVARPRLCWTTPPAWLSARGRPCDGDYEPWESMIHVWHLFAPMLEMGSRQSIASESSCGSRRRDGYGERSLTAIRTAGSPSGETAAGEPSHSTVR